MKNLLVEFALTLLNPGMNCDLTANLSGNNL